MTDLVTTAERDGDLALVPVPRDGGPLAASFLQERLWLVDQMTPGSSAYVVWFALEARGSLDIGAVGRALAAVVDRHEPLRTALSWVDGRLLQDVRPTVPLPLRVDDLRHEAEPAGAARDLLRVEAGTPFDLSRAPLLRVRLLRTEEQAYVLGFFLHHAITDGWSNSVILGDFRIAYEAAVGGRTPSLTPPPLQYADVVAWQRRTLTKPRQEGLLDYWVERLRGAPELTALPVDRPRTSRHALPGGTHRFTLSANVAGDLERLARQERATSYMLVFAALATVLARWSGQDEAVVGSPMGQRLHPDLVDVVGPLVNTVPVRIDILGGPSGRELVRRTRRAVLDAQDHADLPFERLVERLRPRRSALYHPVFQVNLGVREFPVGSLALPGVSLSIMDIPDGRAAKFDLSVYLTTGPGAWAGFIEYAADLFTAQTVARVADGLCAVLTGLGQDPEQPVGSLPLGPLPDSTAAVPLGDAATAAPARVSGPPPRDRWERLVAHAWSQVLGVDRVDVADDFFALGGHSMAAMLVVERISQLVGRRLDLAALFRSPTVESLAAVLRATDTDPDDPYFERMRSPGSRPPLFVTPPAVGDMTPYFPLTNAMSADRAVYGLSPEGLFVGGDPGDLTLEAQAARYANEIARLVPERPAHLCGFSAAGRLAVAVADQLARRGQVVGAVVLLDSAPYGDVPPDPDLATILVRWLDFAPPLEELSTLGREAQIARTLESGQRRGDLPAALGPGEFQRWCRRLELAARALAGHGALAYPGTVTLLYQAYRMDRHIAAEWHTVPVGALRVVPVPLASHMSFVDGSGAAAVARVLERHLRLADDQAMDGRRG